MSEEFLAVREIEEYFFCPMLFYYRNSLGMERPKSLWSGLGKEFQEELSELVRRKFRVVGEQVDLRSERLKVLGKVDFLVEKNGKVIPLEVKYSSRLRPWWRYTIILYAMLVEDTFGGPVKSGLLLLRNRVLEVDVRDGDRRYVLQAIDRCRKILKGEVPRPFHSRSCENCDFRWTCFDKH